MTYRPERPPLRKEKQIRRPSGEMAGGVTTPPSSPRQISVAAPCSNFHSPSAPPRDDTNARYVGPNRGLKERVLATGSGVAAFSVWMLSAIGTCQSCAVGA